MLDIKYALLVVTVEAVRFEATVGRREELEERGAYIETRSSMLFVL